MPGIALMIGEGLSLALQDSLQRLGRLQWVGVIEEAAKGIPTAVAAIKDLIAGAESGKTFSNEELDAMLDHSRSYHDRIQAG